jgi:hypothetical protein
VSITKFSSASDDRVAEAGDAVAELLGPFERDQVAAPGDDVELGAVDLGDDVALHQLDGLDPVVFSSQDENGNVDPVQVGGDDLDDGLRDPTMLGMRISVAASRWA